MKTVVAYGAGVPSPDRSPHKVQLLKDYIQGVNKLGDKGIFTTDKTIIDSDVNLIQGWVHKGSPRSPHLMVRKNAYEINKARKKHTFIVDSNLFNYSVGKIHHLNYHRYSADGIFPTTGNYFNHNVDPNKWKQISADLGISLKDWRQNGQHILITTQRNGGWSMDGLNVVDWLNHTIKRLRKYTDRPIVVRGHPGDKNAKRYLSAGKNYKLSNNVYLIDDLKNCWATVVFNSSPAVASAIEGVPVFITDPIPERSQAKPVANTHIKNIEDPKIFERQNWIEELAMSHWKTSELQDGTAWAHMREFV